MAPQGSVETSYFSEKAQQDLLQLLDNVSPVGQVENQGGGLSAQF